MLLFYRYFFVNFEKSKSVVILIIHRGFRKFFDPISSEVFMFIVYKQTDNQRIKVYLSYNQTGKRSVCEN